MDRIIFDAKFSQRLYLSDFTDSRNGNSLASAPVGSATFSTWPSRVTILRNSLTLILLKIRWLSQSDAYANCAEKESRTLKTKFPASRFARKRYSSSHSINVSILKAFRSNVICCSVCILWFAFPFSCSIQNFKLRPWRIYYIVF